MALITEGYLSTNTKHPITQLIAEINRVGKASDKSWEVVQPKHISNPIEFKQYQKNGLRIAPVKEFATAKEIAVTYTRMSLADVVYRNELSPIYYTHHKGLKWCIWQFNDLFNTAIDPTSENVAVSFVDAENIKFEILNDKDLFYTKSEVILPAVDISLTMKEILGSQTLELSKEEIDYAINLASRKTDTRREQSLLLNPFDALGYSVGLRNFAKNSKRDGLNDYNYDELPLFHKLILENGVRYHALSGNYAIKQVSGRSYNTEVKVELTNNGEDFDFRNEKNHATLRYNRQDILSFVKAFLETGEEISSLTVYVSKALTTDEEKANALFDYLSLDDCAPLSDVVYQNHNAYPLVEIANFSKGTEFNFTNTHPLFTGRLVVNFVVGE